MLAVVLVLFYLKNKQNIGFKITSVWRLKDWWLKKMAGRGLGEGGRQ